MIRAARVAARFCLLLAGIAGIMGSAASAAPPGNDRERGKEAVVRHNCAACHAIPEVSGLAGRAGPSLARIGGRVYIAGVLANTQDNMTRWLRDPPGVDPRTAMPNLGLTEQEARDIAAFLGTLK
ncbi:c-type cytochrome [Noviherbaspirillum galbum]|uniref:C-type cytochrome n=1 Tax=Noviherbaspirillum galbum TaxID=2709383 RepID=A0A6B3SV35_9BURK|nr:c-type cytochrome [Noviherbaspirillum galbum]NEX64920.1 c-type cytochrome [Noviherbaspirillum galbum]